MLGLDPFHFWIVIAVTLFLPDGVVGLVKKLKKNKKTEGAAP